MMINVEEYLILILLLPLIEMTLKKKTSRHNSIASYNGRLPKKVRTVASPVVRSVNKSRDTKWCPTWARLCDLCHFHHPFILQSPRITFVGWEVASTPPLRSSWRWSLWRHRSPQHVSAEHSRCNGDNPWKFRNDVTVWGTKIVLRSVKPIGNGKEWWASHYGVVYKLN